MSILTLENICKSYGEKTLFKDVNFTIENNDKIGLIGINGTGKSSLLRIIAGVDTGDCGTVIIPKGIHIEFLSQNPNLDPEATVLEQIFKTNSKVMNLIRDYESTIEYIDKNPQDEIIQKKLLKLSNEMNAQNAWDIESQIKIILTKLNITNFNEKIKNLSGGQRKRVALSSALITPCDLLILDEPTNHMDNETISWLENYLENRKGALIMITHDRYFLDRVVNKTFELDYGTLYSYTCNYSQFVEKKAERKALENTLELKRQSLYKKELEWIRAGVQARGTKQRARIKRFEDIKNSKLNNIETKLEVSVGNCRLGKKIINIEHLYKSFGENKILEDFNYILLRDDRIGIVGNNGIGKSTLLNLITGNIKPDSGIIDIGSTVKIGYFSQHSEDMNENLRAIEYIREYAEYITCSDGTKISASQMMERFLFTDDMQWSYISKLSGGEKRRLYLLRILMESPNVLILDEPTNDLDIDTLKVLEDYLEDFNGPVISVSHDRYFLDKTCNKIFYFKGNGKITEFIGNYSDFIENTISENKENIIKSQPCQKTYTNKKSKNHQLKFSYKEQIEYDNIQSDIKNLEKDIENLEKDIEKHSTDFVKLEELLNKKDSLEEDLLFKLERQEYLDDLAQKIEKEKLLFKK